MFICMLSISILHVLQLYYELADQRKQVDGKDIAICRVEQLCPFPYDLIQRELKRYPSTSIILTNISLLYSKIF